MNKPGTKLRVGIFEYNKKTLNSSVGQTCPRQFWNHTSPQNHQEQKLLADDFQEEWCSDWDWSIKIIRARNAMLLSMVLP